MGQNDFINLTKTNPKFAVNLAQAVYNLDKKDNVLDNIFDKQKNPELSKSYQAYLKEVNTNSSDKDKIEKAKLFVAKLLESDMKDDNSNNFTPIASSTGQKVQKNDLEQLKEIILNLLMGKFSEIMKSDKIDANQKAYLDQITGNNTEEFNPQNLASASGVPGLGAPGMSGLDPFGMQGIRSLMASLKPAPAYNPNTNYVEQNSAPSGGLINPASPSEMTADGDGKTTGNFGTPAKGVITSHFGPRSSPGGIGSTNHQGIDIGAASGSPITAADGGEVVFAGSGGGYGLLVEVKHANGQTTKYGHCSKILVKKGQKVSKGQEIAKVGSTGNSTGPHLHFEIRDKNGVAINPEKVMKFA